MSCRAPPPPRDLRAAVNLGAALPREPLQYRPSFNPADPRSVNDTPPLIADADAALNGQAPEPAVRPATRGRRRVVVAFTVVAMTLAFTDRVNLAVAAVAMRSQLHWSQSVKGLVLAAFFVGYLVFQVASGALAQRFGGKRVLGIAVLGWSALALLTPLAALSSVALLLVARIGLGIGEAAVVPGSYELFSRWVPQAERGRTVARFLCGIPLGQIAGFSVAGFMTARYGWPSSFYLFGALRPAVGGVFPAPRAQRPAAGSAGGCRRARRAARTRPRRREPVPWRELLSVPMVRAFIVAHFCHNWALYLLVSWLPSYYSEHLGVPLGTAGLYAALPWATNFIALLAGGARGDARIARGGQPLQVRRTLSVLGLAGTAAALLLLPLATSAAVALMISCLATAALGVACAGFICVPLDVTPRHAPVLVGASNTLATIPGIAGVAITGWLLDLTHTYAVTFLLSAAIAGRGRSGAGADQGRARAGRPASTVAAGLLGGLKSGLRRPAGRARARSSPPRPGSPGSARARRAPARTRPCRSPPAPRRAACTARAAASSNRRCAPPARPAGRFRAPAACH